MRTPSEYIAAAVRRVQSSLMPDCKAEMTHGAYSGVVTRVSSFRKGENEVAVDGMTEDARVLALSCDFPEVKKGSIVWICGIPHFVTSARTDPSGVSLYVGVSSPLAVKNCVLRSTRTIGGMTRPTILNFSGYIRIEREDDPFNENAHSSTRQRVTLVARDELFTYEPKIGNMVDFDGKKFAVVSVVNEYNHEYVMELRSC